MTKHSHSPYTSTSSSTPHDTNRKKQHPSHPTQHASTLHGSRNTLFLTAAAAQQALPQTPTQSLHQTWRQTCAIYIHLFFSGHLATRGNDGVVSTPPPHIRNSGERLPRLTRRTLAQLRTGRSPFLKSYLHRVDAKAHPSPLCPLCNIHTHDTHHLFSCTRMRTALSALDLWTDPAGITALLARWTEKLAGGPQVGTSDSPPHWQGSWEWVDNNNNSS